MAIDFAIGLDLGGTNARAAVVDLDGRVLHVAKERIDSRTPEATADALARCTTEVLKAVGQPISASRGVGLGLAAQIDSRTSQVIVAPNLGWRDLDFAHLLSQRLTVPVLMANDLAVATLGEAKAGAAKGVDDAVLVFVGSGIGSGLIMNGRPYRGARGVGGELGHIKVRPGGRLCGCGERGCLEAYAGGINLGLRAAEEMASGRESLIKRLTAPGQPPSTAAVDEAAEQGDPLAIELRKDATELIGVTAANLITQLNPGVLILGGGVLLGSASMRVMVEEVIRANAGRAALASCSIVTPLLGDDAGVIGSAFLARGV